MIPSRRSQKINIFSVFSQVITFPCTRSVNGGWDKYASGTFFAGALLSGIEATSFPGSLLLPFPGATDPGNAGD